MPDAMPDRTGPVQDPSSAEVTTDAAPRSPFETIDLREGSAPEGAGGGTATEHRVEAAWRAGCEQHDTAPAPLAFHEPLRVIRSVLRTIGLLADTGAVEPLLDQSHDATFSCSDVHIGVAQLAVLRRALAGVLELEAPCAERLEKVIEDTTVALVRDCVQELCEAALIDALTGLRNRRAFTKDANREFANAHRTHRPVAVASIDMIGLKATNDVFGHAHGDRALRQLARAVSAALREGDNLYRVGGDEFVVLLPGAAADDAAAVLQRVDAEGCAFRWGVASCPLDGEDPGTLVDLADQRMLAGRAHDSSNGDDSRSRRPGFAVSGRQG